jgi:hypothetical protein
VSVTCPPIAEALTWLFSIGLTVDSWTLLDFLAAGASVVTIVGAVFVAARWGRTIIRALRLRLTRFKPTVPRETIRVVPSRNIWWHMGSRDGEPTMQVVTRWLVTNISDRPTMVAAASMSRGWFRRGHEAYMIMRETIPVGATVEIMIDFWAQPPFRKKDESFSTRLTLVDHLGNRHRTDTLTIPPDWRPKREQLKPTEEIMHSIGDPLVKHIVSILKDETHRYRECGRPVGGLGSVQVTYENRTLKGIGYQGRESDSPRRQWIVPDPEKASIHSDNLAALMSIFERQDQAGKHRIIDALLQRIMPGREYTPIGYFFLLALFRMGQLPAALQTIKGRLRGDEKFGFDDSVKMLSGLLQYEYPRFDDPALDEVERFLDGLDRSAYHIKERWVAARAVLHQAKEIGDAVRQP